jgi:hypothetical protein
MNWMKYEVSLELSDLRFIGQSFKDIFNKQLYTIVHSHLMLSWC